MPSQEVAMVGVTAYRQLLRKLRSNGGAAPTEESAVALQQAKERVLLRLSARRERVQRDPRRAFTRLRDELARLREVKETAKDSIRELGSQRAARLRSAYDTLKQRSLRAVAARNGSDRDEVEILGTNGPLRVLVLGSVLAASKLFMYGLTRTSIEGEAVLTAAQARPPGQPLITVSNHVAAMDDPLLLAALTPLRSAFEPGAVRWSLCATDRCFKNAAMATFFRAGQVLPVERGKGMDQAGMRAAQARLAAGDWVHIFPEGTRSPDGRKMGTARAGVGRLVAACEAPPLLVPIVHAGMERVMPRGSALPVPGQEVRIIVGDPIPVEDLLTTSALEEWPETRLYRAIAGRVSDAMAALKAQLDGAPLLTAAAASAAAGAMDQQQMLPLIEDQLDFDSHSWTESHGSLRAAAGLPSLSALAASAAAATPPFASMPMLAGPAACSGKPVVPRLPLRLLAGTAAEYAQARLAHVAAMLAPTGSSSKLTF